RNPYSDEITREIEAGYYGRPLDASRPYDPHDEQAFAYPVYVVFLLAPTVRIPFPEVQALFPWFLALLTAASALLWLRALAWRPPLITAVVVMVLLLGSFPVLQGLKLQQLTLLVHGFLAGAVALVAAGNLLSAGVLLALATIKPQLVLPLLAWFFVWS